MYEEYAILDAQEKEIRLKKEQLRTAIIMDMASRDVLKEEHGLGKFTVTSLKKWTYSEKCDDLQEKWKVQKAKEESNGTATYVEEPSLRFTGIKI